MAWFIGQSLFVILAAFLLGLLVGWFVWGNKRSASSTSDDVLSVVSEKNGGEVSVALDVALDSAETPRAQGAAAAPDDRPVAGETVTSTELDDRVDDELERIEGIGPMMAAALRAAGIRSFRQLAETDDDTRRAAIEAAGLTFAPSLVTWAGQAQLLADGDEDGFADLTRRLVAGRDTGRA